MDRSSPCNCSWEHDIDLARGVQQLLFPKSSPLCSWCCLGVKNRMAQEVGGDYYDFITLPDGCQLVFIGDVTGHGLQASLVMALLYGYIHRAAQVDCDPLRLAREMNRFLRIFASRSQRLDHFFSTTFFCCVIDPDSLEMAYINAGHMPPMVRRGAEVVELGATGPPLGYFDKPELAPQRFTFRRDDRLLLYTDGIVEAFNSAGEAYGRRRLTAVLKGHAGDHLAFLESIHQSLRQFGANDPPDDDCTTIAIDFHPLPG